MAVSAGLRVARVCLKSFATYPVAWIWHLYALVCLPITVTLALARTLGGVKGEGVDDVLGSFIHSRAPGDDDRKLLIGLREKHNVAVAAMKDQLGDSESRYKAVYEKLRESERMRQKLQLRLTTAQEALAAARGKTNQINGRGGAPESPSTPRGDGGWDDVGGGGGGGGNGGDTAPLYFTTLLCVGALLYFYDVPDVPAFDRKLAMLAPGAWMSVIGLKHPALNKILILGNLVFFGYLTHIIVAHRREGSPGVSSSARGCRGRDPERRRNGRRKSAEGATADDDGTITT
jgi:hypothetical protein